MPDSTDYADKHFLVVDDQPYMAELITRMLRSHKPRHITNANDGVQALKTVGAGGVPVDCIISDFNMKPINGLQLLQGIRMGLNPNIPRNQTFVLVTGHGDAEVVKAALGLDVSGYLVKPLAQEKLIETIDRALERPVTVKEPSAYKAITLPKP
jgi:two-component system chemotaxis response regulator CheY